MTTLESRPQERPFFALVKVLRHIRGARERRLLRAEQERERWIDEARNAPTVQDWIDRRGR